MSKLLILVLVLLATLCIIAESTISYRKGRRQSTYRNDTYGDEDDDTYSDDEDDGDYAAGSYTAAPRNRYSNSKYRRTTRAYPKAIYVPKTTTPAYKDTCPPCNCNCNNYDDSYVTTPAPAYPPTSYPVKPNYPQSNVYAGDISYPAINVATYGNGDSNYGCERHYAVRAGDTLLTIAQKTGVPAPQIARMNGITVSNRMTYGQRLCLVRADNVAAYATTVPSY